MYNGGIVCHLGKVINNNNSNNNNSNNNNSNNNNSNNNNSNNNNSNKYSFYIAQNIK